MRGGTILAVLLTATFLTPAARAEPALSIDAAARAFDEICVRQAPWFRRSASLMARHGLTWRKARGEVHRPDGRLWAKVRAMGRGRQAEGPHCSVYYAVPDPKGAMQAIETIIERLFEDAWNRREVSTEVGGTGTAWTVEIHGTMGEMLHVPYSEDASIGIMTIRF